MIAQPIRTHQGGLRVIYAKPRAVMRTRHGLYFPSQVIVLVCWYDAAAECLSFCRARGDGVMDRLPQPALVALQLCIVLVDTSQVQGLLVAS